MTPELRRAIRESADIIRMAADTQAAIQAIDNVLVNKYGLTREQIGQNMRNIHYGFLHGEEPPCDLPENWGKP